MNPDPMKQAWQTQSSHGRLLIDADLLLQEVRRNQRHFAAVIFWRDVREVGTALLLAPAWIYLGARWSLPWTWYLMVPVLLGIAGFMLLDRLRHTRRAAEPGEPLRQRVESSLAQVEHQIWMLRNIFWWYLLPPSLAMLAFFGQLAWESRAGGWLTALSTGGLILVVTIVYAAIYRLNQHAIRIELEPRRQELVTLLMSLKDESPLGSTE